jgi:hypothetical protein
MAPPKADSKTAEVTPVTRMTKLASYLQTRAHSDSAEESIGGGMQQIAENVLAASTPEELWDADEGGMPDGRDMADVEQRIIEFEVKKSTDPEKTKEMLGGTFLIVRCARLDNGEEVIWNTSAPLLVTKIIQAERMSMLPLDAVIRATDLGGGKAVLKLRPVPKRTVTGATA